MQHLKHTKLTKPIGGLFHRNELAFIGAPCDVIAELFNDIVINIPSIELAVIDADHNSGEIDIRQGYIDKIKYHQYNIKENHFNKRPFLLNYSGVLINANHFNGEAQIVILNSKKKESLSRKLDRLTNVVLIITDDVTELYDYLKGMDKLINVPIIPKSNITSICKFITEFVSGRKPSLLGCILTGGKSTRMGQDKALLEYHNMPQYEYVKSIFFELGIPSVISATEDSQSYIGIDSVIDEFVGLGPFGGILSIMKKYPNSAIITCPCDVPMVDKSLFSKLIDERDTSKIATCFYNPETDFPEPLITIWEPQAYSVLLEFLALGYSCPRKVLINSNIKMIDLKGESYRLVNVNTPEDKTKVEAIISKFNETC